MELLILAIAMIILALGLGFQIGIASWQIRRANRYKRATRRLEGAYEHLKDKFGSLDKYATDISWLLDFLYSRYSRFEDIENELTRDSEEPIENLDDKKKALRLIKITVRAADNIKGCMKTIASQISLIENEFNHDEDEEEDDTPPENEG